MNAQRELHAAGAAVAGAFDPAGAQFALADRTGVVRVFRVSDGKLIRTLKVGSPLNTVAFSPDGLHVATGSRDGKPRIWDLASPELPVQVLAQGDPVTWVAYSPDGKQLLTTGGSSARLWDTASGILVHTLPHAHSVLKG